MTREDSIRQIENYPPFNEQEEKDKALILGWISNNENAFSRENTVAHITASAWVVNKDRSKVLMVVFEGRHPKARELIIISVLCAIAVAGRLAFTMLPQFKPVVAIVIISGVAFGGESGFLVGAVSMLVSNLMFGQGPWTPWQMFAAGIIGFIGGILFKKGLLGRTRTSLCIYGFIATMVIYGGLMNLYSALTSHSAFNLNMLITFYVQGFPMDIVHAVSTVIFLFFGAEPMLEKLDRIKVKYGLIE